MTMNSRSTMDVEKQKALEAAGWRFGDAADFLGMSEEERQLLDARIEAALAVRRQREALNLSQQQLAKRIKTSQPRIARIERAAPDVSLDQILRAFAAAGGRIIIRQGGDSPTNKTNRRSPKKATKKAKSVSSSPDPKSIEIELIGSDS